MKNKYIDSMIKRESLKNNLEDKFQIYNKK